MLIRQIQNKIKNKLKEIICIISLMMVAPASITAQQIDFLKLTGSYLGQNPPLKDPSVFAPGIVSNGSNASSPAISPDGKEICWDVNKIWMTRIVNGTWSKPEIASFCKNDEYLYRVPCYSPDGRKLFFLSTRPGSVSGDKENIWYVEKTLTGWSDPKAINSKVNSLRIHWNISVSAPGTLYFQGTRLDISDNGGIYYSNIEKDEYVEPVKLGPEINETGTMTTCPYIAPDESFIIFNKMGNAPEKSGIFISFRDESGKWKPAKMLVGGSREKGGLGPRITPDGKYLLYVNGDVYWMPVSKLIDELRSKE